MLACLSCKISTEEQQIVNIYHPMAPKQQCNSNHGLAVATKKFGSADHMPSVTGWTVEQRSDLGVIVSNYSQRRVALRCCGDDRAQLLAGMSRASECMWASAAGYVVAMSIVQAMGACQAFLPTTSATITAAAGLWRCPPA
ncbi:hypothetical protein GOP47_0023442 [Adiantum capillus-veneris]|uniref:Uncharacterized protein n=1 Tax=Adiantum capillus-veneris TaxID=13818 RepID=A0A9D4Z548_ADICA|nr:hypothetical protein GOP47_0023442 [Adiantum capillus-veneris]